MPIAQNAVIVGGHFANYEGVPKKYILFSLFSLYALFASTFRVIPEYRSGSAVRKSEVAVPRPGGERQDALEVLNPYVASNAFFNTRYQEEPARCHPGTRVRILTELEERLNSSTPATFVWTHGPAGVGKTAVMRTLCEVLDAKGQLLGSFVFFKGDPTRNSGQPFVPTLAYHMCQALPPLREYVQDVFRNNPAVLTLGLKEQAQRLLVEPILNLARTEKGLQVFGHLPRAIVVDGLDECDPEYDRSQVIDVLDLISQSYPSPLTIFVASRPHLDILAHFESSPLLDKTSQQRIYQDNEADADIRKYLMDKFKEILERHPLRNHLPRTNGSWPSAATFDTLVDKASGQFIFASTIVRFVEARNANPNHRLNVVLGHLRSTDSDDDDSLRPFEQLDKVYRAIFATVSPFRLQKTLDILSISVVYPVLMVRRPSPTQEDPASSKEEPASASSSTRKGGPAAPNAGRKYPVFPLETLGVLFSGRETYCHELLVNMEALVRLTSESSPNGQRTHLQFFHKSLIDFLTSESRAGPDLFVAPERSWESISMASIRNNFWHEDPDVRSAMLDIRHPSQIHQPSLEDEARRSERQTAPRLLSFMNTPEVFYYDYVEAATRFPGPRRAHHIRYWLECVALFIDNLSRPGLRMFSDIHAQHLESFERYLRTSISVYETRPELWVFLASKFSLDKPPNIDNHLDSALAYSPGLQVLDREQGFALSANPAESTPLDTPFSSFAGRIPGAIRDIAFGPSAKPWCSILAEFARRAVERREVSVPVAQVIFSATSLRHAAGGITQGQSVDKRPLKMFLEAFPAHLDAEQRSDVERLIGPDRNPHVARAVTITFLSILAFYYSRRTLRSRCSP